MQNLRNKSYQFLRSSENFFKTDMVYLTKGGFWLLSSQVIVLATSFALSVAFANLIDPEKYGNYKYVLVLANIMAALTLSGLGTAVMRALARNKDGTLKYAFNLSLLWSIGIVIISAVIGTYYLANNNWFIGASLFIIGVSTPIIVASSLYQPFLLGKQDFKRAAIFSLLQNTLPALFVLVALLLKAPLIILVSIYFLVSVVTVYILYKKTQKLATNDEVDPITDHLGKHLSVIGVISTISGKLDSILIFQLLGGAQLAIFSIATALPDMIRGSLKHITSLATPKFAQKTKAEMKIAVWSKTRIVLLFTTIISVVYILIAPLIFELFFPKYIESIRYSQVYSLTLIMSLLVASAYFDAQAAMKERYILNIVINGTAIITTVVGIYWLGIWGAVLARLFTRIVNVSLSAFLIKKN